MADENTPVEEQPDEDSSQEQETTDQVEDNEPDESEDTDDGFDAEKAKAKIRKINSENKNLRKRATDAEAKAKDAGDKDAKLTALEAENLRLKIGVKHGLPESLVKRLSGTTEEELLQDAEELMELFSSKKPPTNRPKENLRGGTDPTVESEEMDLDKLAGKIFR